MIELAKSTDSGPRSRNEDAVLAEIMDNGNAILAVADGLGGHFGGAEAASLAIKAIREQVAYTDLRTIIQNVHRDIVTQQSEHPDLKGMATTITAINIVGNSLFGAHCGDTRCVVQRGVGIKRLTNEHTEARRLLNAGKLTKAEFLRYPRRNVLDSAIGAALDPIIDTFEFDLREGDKIVVTSDGVHEKLLLREMLEVLKPAKSASAIVNLLRQEVMRRGPEDNFSIAAAVI